MHLVSLIRALYHESVYQPSHPSINQSILLTALLSLSLPSPLSPATFPSVWIMASIAVVGNLLVLAGRYFYKSRSNVEHSLYLRHLAASDFLMGIYLTLIACADISFRGQYIRHEESWRHSELCAFAGG